MCIRDRWGCSGCGRASRRGAAARRRRRSRGSGALAVAREGSDGRDVAVPRRRRSMMPALRDDDAGQAGAGDPHVAELVLEDRERLAVLRAGRRREVGLRQERVDRRGEVDARCDREAERAPAAGSGHEGLFYSRTSSLTRPRAGRLRRKRVVFAHDQRGAPALAVPRRLAIAPPRPVDFAGNGAFPACLLYTSPSPRDS